MIIGVDKSVFVYKTAEAALLVLERVIEAEPQRGRCLDQYLRRPLQRYLGNLEVRPNENYDLDSAGTQEELRKCL